MGIGDMIQARLDTEDAARYRFLRDSAGNNIMRKLMGESRTDEWDKLVDAEIARHKRIALSEGDQRER